MLMLMMLLLMLLILIGKKGSALKKIGQGARNQIEKIDFSLDSCLIVFHVLSPPLPNNRVSLHLRIVELLFLFVKDIKWRPRGTISK